MKNTTYTKKILDFDTVFLTFTKGYFILYNEKGVFYWISKSAISVEKGMVFFRPKFGCFSNLGTSMVYALVGNGVGWGGGGVGGWGWGEVGVGVGVRILPCSGCISRQKGVSIIN